MFKLRLMLPGFSHNGYLLLCISKYPNEMYLYHNDEK